MDFDWSILRSGEQTIYRLRGLYEKYGYRRFKMSKFEAYDLYVRNKDFLVSDRMITFTDARGTLMALKPDVTLSILKNTRPEEPGPRKVYYNENVYRTDKSGETFQEIMQTGLECIGDLDLYHIYEVIALAVASLASIHPAYILNISHMGLVSGFMEAAGVDPADYGEVLSAVREKNMAALAAFCRDRGLSGTVQSLLEKLVTTYGPMDTVLGELAPLCVGGKKTREAWEEISRPYPTEDELEHLEQERRMLWRKVDQLEAENRFLRAELEKFRSGVSRVRANIRQEVTDLDRVLINSHERTQQELLQNWQRREK